MMLLSLGVIALTEDAVAASSGEATTEVDATEGVVMQCIVMAVTARI